MTELSILELRLHQELAGYLAAYNSGKNILLFADEFRVNPERSTLSLLTHPDFPNADKLLQADWSRMHRLHPLLSNLLPEGALRELLAQSLKVHADNEFQLFYWLSSDLPGALRARPLAPEEVPASLKKRLKMSAGETVTLAPHTNLQNKFSLAGVQMKFSMREKEGRYTLMSGSPVNDALLGDWIIKTPSTRHPQVPVNEFSAMSLAAMVSVDIPPIKLVALDQLDNLPPINLPQEQYAFAIRRFDRISAGTHTERVHMEDFAQLLGKYPYEKYGSANYEQIGRIIYTYSGDALADSQQLARRLLVNILLANGDAHLKNWSLFYPDAITPRLPPAYDILTTSLYIQGEHQFALNLAKNKDWYQASMRHFEYWAEKSGMPWRSIQRHLQDVVDKARTDWPQALNNLPMTETHKAFLRQHWRQLHQDLRLL